MFTVVFKKRFTDKMVKEIEIVESIQFPNEKGAQSWIFGVDMNIANGQLGWEFCTKANGEKMRVIVRSDSPLQKSMVAAIEKQWSK